MEEEDEQELEYGRRKRSHVYAQPGPVGNFSVGFSVSLERNFFDFRHYTHDFLPWPLVNLEA